MDLHDLHSLTFHRVLGRGALGTVFLVSLPTPPSSSPSPPPPPFALKLIDTSTSPSSLHRFHRELSVLTLLPPHPFLPSLLSHLDQPDLKALALPFCSGSDLHSLRLHQPDHLFSPSSILFYSSELLSALRHLHLHRIVYRDLKPDNILIQPSGHVTLSDFDLSHPLPPIDPQPHIPPTRVDPHPSRRRRPLLSLRKAKSARVSDTATQSNHAHQPRCHSFVGTEEYVSPEVVRGEAHGFAVDWWALGVVMYEMAYGRTPFKGRNRKETFRNVVLMEPEFAGGRGRELTDVIRRLLVKDPSKRLGSGGAEEVMGHPFFRGVRWEMLADVGRPPYVPPPVEEVVGGGEVIDIGVVREYVKGTVTAAVGSPAVGSPASLSLAEF